MKHGLAVLALVASPVAAQTPPPASLAGDSVLATPRGRYDAGGLHRALLNEGYRDLWETPIRVEVLDLGEVAGGLTVTGLGGGQQTRSIRLRGEDGVVYGFRSIDKDVSRGIDPILRRTVAERVLQDQIGSLLPTGALVVAPLLEAVGVLHADPRLYIMPDDPRLGDYRAEFAGVLGFLEERPNEGPDEEPGFAGSTRVTGSESFLERLEDDPRNRVDARAYLKARLMDFLVGDWDRHPDQWRWASFVEGDSVRWLPVPRDRDWAFARLDGLLIQVAAIPFPQYTGFDADVASIFRLSYNGRALDRRLLSELTLDAYETVAGEVVGALGDEVIADAVHRLPRAHYERVGAQLETGLRMRRDALPRLSREFHALLAGWTDIDTTDEDETARLERLADGRLHVHVRAGSRQVFDRTFDPAFTNEVRLYLHGGDDTATVEGTGPAAIRIRIIGGGSDDVLTDVTGGDGVAFYDHRGDNTLRIAGRTSIHTDDWDDPDPGFQDPPGARPRDWGSWGFAYPSVSYQPDIGLLLGGMFVHYGYGFRRLPWKSRFAAGGAVSTSGVVRGGLDYEHALSRRWFGELRVRGSALEVDRFYGFGNETSTDEDDDYYHARRRVLDVETLLRWRPARDAYIAFGPFFRAQWSVEEPGTFIDAERPYGYGDNQYLGLAAEAWLDARDARRAATRGSLLTLRAEHVPSLLDADADWTSLSGRATLYLTPDILTEPTFAFRIGGDYRHGLVPYTDAAYLGSADDLRGYRTRRFAGKSAAFGNAEVRFPLGEVFLLLPLDLGLIGLVDAGRVWVADDDSDRWHSGVGGGLWIGVLSRANAATFTLVNGSEGLRFYFGGGFAF